jgi:hypothetical protein
LKRTNHARFSLRRSFLRKAAFALATVTALAAYSAAPSRAAVYSTVNQITTISYAPDSYVIGNAYPNWTDVIQGPAQYNSGNGIYYRWGYLFGPSFDFCAWINDGAKTSYGSTVADRCGNPQQINTPYFLTTFTDGWHNSLATDGSTTYYSTGMANCNDHNGYGNVEPWRVPATPGSTFAIPTYFQVKWRYISKDGNWTLIRDPNPQAGQPNWYFVRSACITSYPDALYQPNGAATMTNSRPMLVPTAQVRRVDAMSPRFPAAFPGRTPF